MTARTEGANVYHEPRVAEPRYMYARPTPDGEDDANYLIPRQTLVGYRRGTEDYLLEPMSARPDLIPLGISMSDDLQTAATSTTSSPICAQAGRVGGLDNSSEAPVGEADFLSTVYAENNFTIRRDNGDVGDGPIYSELGIYLGVKENPENADLTHFVWIPEYPATGASVGGSADLTELQFRAVRGGVGTNVADLAAFTVAGHYGLTFTEDDLVFLLGQTTAEENGPYVVGVVATGVAPLTRPSWWAADSTQATGDGVVIQEGNAGSAGLRFFVSTPGGVQVDTDDPAFQLVAPPSTRSVRGVVDAAIASLAAFAVSGGGRDGLTYVEGDVFLAVLQGTGTADGPYVVGPVAGTAPAVRPLWWLTGSIHRANHDFDIAEGTAWGGKTWYATATGEITVGTTDPDFYPREQNGIVTLSTGATVTGVWLKSATKSRINLQNNTPAGTTTTVLAAPVASRVIGVAGTGQFAITAHASDTSTVDWTVRN